MRFKKRFVFVRSDFSPAEAKAFFTRVCKALEDSGLGRVSLKHFDEEKKEAVVKCLPKALAVVKKAFSSEKGLSVVRVSAYFHVPRGK